MNNRAKTRNIMSRRHYSISQDIIEFDEEIDRTFASTNKEDETMNCIYCNSVLTIRTETKKLQNCPNCKREILYCEICKNLILRGENILRSTKCGHIFHEEHIIEWINVKNICPVCKKPLNNNMLETHVPQRKKVSKL